MGYSDQRRGCDGLVWMSLTSRLSFRYLLLFVLLFRPLTIMLIDLLPVSGRGGKSRSS
jgi:hypothetical protein